MGMVFRCYVTRVVRFDGNGVPVLCHGLSGLMGMMFLCSLAGVFWFYRNGVHVFCRRGCLV